MLDEKKQKEDNKRIEEEQRKTNELNIANKIKENEAELERLVAKQEERKKKAKQEEEHKRLEQKRKAKQEGKKRNADHLVERGHPSAPECPVC